MPQVLDSDLRLLVYHAWHDLKPDPDVLGIILSLFLTVVIKLIRHRTQVSFAEGGIVVIVAEHYETQLDLPLHSFGGGESPARCRYLAWLARQWVNHIIARATTARPRDVAIAPRSVLVDMPVATQRL